MVGLEARWAEGEEDCGQEGDADEEGDWERGRASNREICRAYPMCKEQIRKVWMSCSRKETRSKPTW
jgi:hypothetical protein